MSQNEITTSLILRSTEPNFERDSFVNKLAMEAVDASWMDDGHISYCQADGNHYIYRSKDSKNNPLEGFDRWTLLEDQIISVQTKTDLTALNASQLSAGTLVFVKDALTYYCVVAPSEGSNWFRPLFDDVVTKEELEEQQFITKREIDELDFASTETLSNYAKLTDIQGLAKKQDLNGLVKNDQLDSYATKGYVRDQGFAKTSDLTKYSTKDEIVEQNFAKMSTLSDYVTKDDLESKDYASKTYVDHRGFLKAEDIDIQNLAKKQDLNGLVKNDQLTPYATKDYVREQGFVKASDLTGYTTKDYVESKYATKDQVRLQEYDIKDYVDTKFDDCATKTFVEEQGFITSGDLNGLVSKTELEEEYATKTFVSGQGFIKEHQDISHLATKDELGEYVKQGDIPTIENAVTKEDLEGYVKQEELTPIQNQLTTLNTVAGSIQTDLNEYKEDVAETYATKTNLNDYVKYTAFQDENRATNTRIQKVEASSTNLQTDLNEYKEDVAETYATKEELEDHISDFTTYKQEIEEYKELVDQTYVKPEDVSSKLNNYSPSTEHENRWIGADCAGDLAGKTGKEVANAAYSYSEVFDQMLFSKFTPTISQPSVEIALKENWKNDLTIDWYDEKKRIILVEAGSAGPDGGDFVAVNAKDAIISYPKGIDLSTNYTNGLIPPTDEQQTSIGFCRIQDEDGNWVYYRKENNIYHVPATLEEGEYRYYMAAYFKEGSPAIDNDNLLVSKWNENTPVESKDYITFYVSKPSYSYTEEGFVKNPLQPWTDNMVDYMTCEPSCVLEQMFKTPRKLKELCIFNGVGGYAPVPMVYAKDEDGLLTDNLVPAYFTESVDEDGYYTYIYDSSTNGHRGEIKIKAIY